MKRPVEGNAPDMVNGNPSGSAGGSDADWDAIVVGGGPAGMAAAIWLGRFRRRTLLVDADEGRNRWVEQAHGYLGLDPLVPADLRRRGREELARYPTVRTAVDRVLAARRAGEGMFAVTLADGGDTTSRRLVLATGVRDEFPAIDRFFEFYGSDIFHCSACDGFGARNRAVAVVGWGEHLAGFAVGLLDWAASLTVITGGSTVGMGDASVEALTDVGVEVVHDQAMTFVGRRGELEGIALGGGGFVPCSIAFFSIAHHPVTDLASALGCHVDEEGYVAVDNEAATAVPGVYAAGDLTPGMQLIAVGVGKGTVAGVSCARSLHGEGAVRGAPEPAPDPDEVLPDG
jgi:thioredoxin reductase